MRMIIIPEDKRTVHAKGRLPGFAACGKIGERISYLRNQIDCEACLNDSYVRRDTGKYGQKAP